MNNILDQSTITATAVFNSTLSIASGKLLVAAGGITSNELAANAVTATAILDGMITNAKINAAAAIDPSKLGTGAITATATVTTANIIDASVTAPKLNGEQTGAAPIYGARAWAKLNPYVDSVRTTAYKSGNYVTSGGNTTVTIAGHGLKANDKIRLDFTSGTATDNLYTVVSSADANNFVVSGAGGINGLVTAQFVTIQASGNISTASWYDSGDNRIVLNFSTPMASANYALCATSQYYPGAWIDTAAEDTLGLTQLNTVNQAHVVINNTSRFLNVVIFG